MRKERTIRLAPQGLVLERVRGEISAGDKINGVFYDSEGNITGYSRIVRMEPVENLFGKLLRNILNTLNAAGVRI